MAETFTPAKVRLTSTTETQLVDKKARVFLDARETYVYETGIALVGTNAQVRVAKTAGTDAINVHAETVVYS